jgi:ParB family chromosome partitioning protein
MSELQTIHITEIRKTRAALRPVRRNIEEYVEMVESIKRDGILQPILVRPKKGKYEVVEGSYRFACALEAGLTTIPCIVRKMTDREALIAQVKCNAIRPKTHTYEYARRLRKFMDEGMTIQDISVALGKTPHWIRDQLQLHRLCEEARDPVARGEIKMTAAIALANLPAEIQPKYVDDAIGMNAKDFTERAEAALREYKAFLLTGQADDYKQGIVKPKLIAVSRIRKEADDLKEADAVLKAAGAETALDGWQLCLAWLFKLDPLSVQRRKEKYREKKLEYLTQSEYRNQNRRIIENFVNKPFGDSTDE